MTARTRGRELRFQLLGQLQVTAESGDIELGSPKQRSVLAVLLLHANEIVPTDRIIEMVWGDKAPRTAEHSVQIYVSELRKALANGSPSDLIDTRPPGYVINVPPDSVDTMRFERLVRDGLSAVRAGDLSIGKPKLESAVAAWTSEPLAEFAYEDFAQGYVRSLSELHSDALETLASLELEQGDLDRAREMAREAILADPLREEPRRVMMLTLYRNGRQAEALRHFSEYQLLLAEELGIEPSESIRQLEEQMLLQDPSLDLQTPATTAGNPYRGLRAFSEDDSDLYFGREDLVAEVLERLENGPGFVSIVGPSGSGKSSAARAGVIPEMRERGFEVAAFQPGGRPLWEFAGALDGAGFGSRGSLLRRLESDSEALAEILTRPLLLVVDQFEELFTLAEDDVVVRLSELLANAIRDHTVPLKVVVTLRADYYDKPLSIPSLAGVFTESVVSVRPMTPREIERAAVKPAEAAGKQVEQALVAQLVADMGDKPGALPLLQFALFELFEGSSNGLTLEGYNELGGINGALTGGADDLLAELDTEGRDLAEQLMMRMVQKGRALSTSRPVAVRDLIDLGIDHVALQGVLEAFGTRRLITFDRDASGAAVVEMAHEYLISEWPQMERWLDEHSEDLDRLYALEASASDWVSADRSDDYLLRGDRLERFEKWQASTTLRLTKVEREFIEASVELRDRELVAARDQAAEQEALRLRARRRLWYFGGAVASLAASVTLLVMTLIPDPPPEVVATYCCRGDGGFGSRVAAGLDAGLDRSGLTLVEVGTSPQDHEFLFETAAAGTGLIISDGVFSYEAVEEILELNPELIIGHTECNGHPVEAHPRVWCVVPSNHEMGFLAGAAAGLMTETGHVGMILGVDTWNMFLFIPGFEQGVRHTNPDATIDVVFLSSVWPYEDLTGFGSVGLGETAATHMYESGADVIFAAAGFSNKGIHQAAFEHSERTGNHVWSIGADADEWEWYDSAWWPDWVGEQEAEFLSEYSEQLQGHILTSSLKHSSVGIALVVEAYISGANSGDAELTVANSGMGLAYSGGHLDEVRDELDRIVSDIESGRIVVESNVDDVAHPPYLWEVIAP